MSLISLDKYNDLDTPKMPDLDGLAMFMVAEFEQRSKEYRARNFAQSRDAGGVYLITSDKAPEAKGMVLEYVAGVNGDDMMLTLFNPHPILNSPAELIRARAELIEMYERCMGAAKGRVMIPDRNRGRKLLLVELGTMQIIDGIRAHIRRAA